MHRRVSGIRQPHAAHVFDSSGVDAEGLRYWRCTCGWETPKFKRVRQAADAFKMHVGEITDAVGAIRSGRTADELAANQITGVIRPIRSEDPTGDDR